jgi:hypothetical protein
VAGHEYARPNIGASITPGSSGNGALPTHKSEKEQNKESEANNRVRTLHTGCSTIHTQLWIRVFDEAAMGSRRTSSRASSKSPEMRDCNLNKPGAISYLK